VSEEIARSISGSFVLSSLPHPLIALERIFRPFTDQIPFELGKSTQDLELESTHAGRGVDVLLNGDKADSLMLEFIKQREKMLQASAHPVQFRDHDRIELESPHVFQKSVEFRSLIGITTVDIAVDIEDFIFHSFTVLFADIFLNFGILFFGRNTDIDSDFHFLSLEK